jgi:two-component system CheB/CheR fusion protein
MGGSIRVESREGRGSTFHVVIPFAYHEIAPRVLEQRENKWAAVWESPPINILLAEDNEINRNIFTTLFQKSGHVLTIAFDGIEALSQWEKGGIDLILMDVQMPGMDGIEATKLIRESERETGGHTPIIALTAYAMREDRNQFLNLGFDGYVSKPIQIWKLKKEMLRCLEKH